MRTSYWVLPLIVVAAIVAIWFVPPYLADSEIIRHGTLGQVAAIEPDKYALVIDEYRKTVSQAIAGLGFLGTLWISVLTLRANQRARVTERFAKALDHLGAVRSEGENAASEVRIGAVSELEGVGEESPREQRMIRSSFIAYLRHYANWSSAVGKGSPAMWKMKETQAMMSVLGRWGLPAETKADYRLADVDFRHLHLLPQANLANFIIAKSHFDHAVLEGVSFRNADLTQTVFSGARLAGADFRGANLSECVFVGKVSSGSAVYWGLKNDKGQFLWGGCSRDADLKGADMRGVDLSSTRMTQKQYESVTRDSHTRLPRQFL